MDLVALLPTGPLQISNSYVDDIVSVFDVYGEQVFDLARPIKATVREEAKLMEHPVENGTTITDHRVILPVEVELSLMLTSEEFADVYQTIRKLFHASAKLTVQTMVGTYGNLIIQKMPHDESPDVANGVTLALTLKEVKIVEAQVGPLPPDAVKHSQHASTTQRGQQSEKTTPGTKTSTVKSAVNSAVSWLKGKLP